jgi:hypothetical protein
MADRVYLHIGAPKTGTSYLQKMIWANKKSLRQQGFFMPPGSRRKQFDAVSDMRGGMWAAGDLSATWDLLAQRVRDRPGTALVSEELLCATPPEQIERLVESLAPVPVHVIFAARDIGRQVPAEWQQALRSRSPMTYDEWLSALRDDPERSFWNVQDPVAVHRRWGPALEPGHFHVLTVPQPGAPSSLLWERFAGIMGLDPEQAEAPESRQNESLGLVEAELLRRFNARLGSRFPLRKPYVDVVRDHLMRPALFGAPGARRIGVPDAYVEWVTQRSEQMVREVAELEGQVTVSGSADELLAAITVAEESPADLSDSELLEAALDAWVRQMEDVSGKLERTRERRAQGQQAAAVEAPTEEAEQDTDRQTGLGRLRGRLRGGR